MVAATLYNYVHQRSQPNPFHLGDVGLPTIHESPWPTHIQFQHSNLPWIMDPASAWPQELKELSKQPCGLAAVLQQRYHLWLPAAAKTLKPIATCAELSTEQERLEHLARAGFTAGKIGLEGPQLQPLAKGEGWVLEQHTSLELVLTHEGLLLRAQALP